jgi:opacity protein-like surface antigen
MAAPRQRLLLTFGSRVQEEKSIMRRFVAFAFVITLIAAVPASAQDKKINWNIGGGYTFATGAVRDYLGDGYNINLGLIFNVTPVVGIQAEYSFNGLGKKQIDLAVSGAPGGASTNTPFYADMNMQFWDVNLVLKPKMDGRTHPYFVAGAGVYYRPVKVTTPGVGFVPGFCSPYWYYCSPGGFVPVTNIVGSRSSTDIGVDFGAGVNIQMSDKASVYLEARYHYIWGPSVANPTAGTSTKANGQFLPITVGIRF